MVRTVSNAGDTVEIDNTQVETNKASITALTSSVSVNTGNVAIAASDISANTISLAAKGAVGDITANSDSISANSAIISTHTNNINTNSGNIATNTAGVSGLVTDLTAEYFEDTFNYGTGIISNEATMTSNLWQVAGYLRVKYGNRFKVTLRGVLKKSDGSDIAAALTSTRMLTLPVGYRPPGAVAFVVIGHCTDSPSRHWVNVDISGHTGQVKAYSTRAITHLDLSGIEFWTT